MRRKKSQEPITDLIFELIGKLPWWGCLIGMAVLFVVLRFVIPAVLPTELVYKPEPNKIDTRFLHGIFRNAGAYAANWGAPLFTFLFGGVWVVTKLKAWSEKPVE